jgi:predicted metal-dependent hydrolase
MMEYQLVRSHRKTLAIHILQDATVQVRAPKRLSKKEIERFLEQKKDWILQKQAEMRSFQPKQPKECLERNDTLWLQGKEYPIRYGEKLQFTGECFVVPKVEWETLKPSLIRLYKSFLAPLLQQKVQYYAKIMNVQPKAVKINSAMKRWGSCSGKNSLNFTFLLAMVGGSELSYVVVHELAHIKQHNHSPAFWNEVKAILPDYKLRQNNLKEMQKRIHTIW